MIDIHNHILVNMDDGPKTKQAMIQLLTQAKEEGITGVIATPHHLNPKFNNSFQNVSLKLAEMRKIPEIKDLGIELFPGQEVRLTGAMIKEIEYGSIQGLNKSRYLLIELPFGDVPDNANRLCHELQYLGYIPIIAHPERNKAIAKNPYLLYELICNGALSQLTASSLLGDFGRSVQKLSLRFMDCHLAHFIASDAHSVEHRPFVLNQLFDERKLIPYRNKIEEMIENAKAIVNNEVVYSDIPCEPEMVRRFLR
ncbi:tyrosine-protein phosphatase [Staphylococcus warneri]|uniref:tyrosine-protein phosphatase n=1 Tax=Staphylococcus warneri TaxID=1292 RepID=UPI00066D0EF0|nr:CpsB/CapC family capsule biosynthesis tyrosine phosphatase [Staphylococcus warneri]MBY6180855.1 capsular biosynthesis protein [Staphylococcaceae bacterium DP2N0-1]MCI2789536.1 capsular biosynthesis protein [Staphylococcus warneri]RQM98659.1 capsular biosynthesis protein [Staphylococcus warneri]